MTQQPPAPGRRTCTYCHEPLKVGAPKALCGRDQLHPACLISYLIAWEAHLHQEAARVINRPAAHEPDWTALPSH